MKNIARYIIYIKIGVAAALVIVVAALVWWIASGVKESELDIETSDQIDITPQQIAAIKDIGEWEFLSVSNEEMVDTTRKGIFSDDHLVRIYYGTLRLGINLHQVQPGWIETKGDSVSLTLPPIILLDNDFIDEARTRSFYESGKWKPADREALYQRAYKQMIAHVMTDSNLKSAEANAERQFRSMMKAMGFKRIAITFDGGSDTK